MEERQQLQKRDRERLETSPGMLLGESVKS
jgi:hypothetical protein